MPDLISGDGLPLIVLGLLVLTVAFVLRRGVALRKRSPGKMTQNGKTPDERASDRSAQRRLNELEVRLYDFSREVEGRMHTQMATLDRLIADADREIERLRALLAESRSKQGPDVGRRRPDIVAFPPDADDHPPDTGYEALRPGDAQETADRRVIVHLHEAGYSLSEIATLTDSSPERVRGVLQEEADGGDETGHAEAA